MTRAPAGGRAVPGLDRLDPVAPDHDQLVAADLAPLDVHQAAGPDRDDLRRLRSLGRARATAGRQTALAASRMPSLPRLMRSSEWDWVER